MALGGAHVAVPLPIAAHLEALTEYLENFYKTIVLSDEEASLRKSVVDELEKDILRFSQTLKGTQQNIKLFLLLCVYDTIDGDTVHSKTYECTDVSLSL